MEVFKALFMKIKVIIFICFNNLCSDTVVTAQWCNVINRTGPQWSILLIEVDPMLLGYFKHVLCGILTLNIIDLWNGFVQRPDIHTDIHTHTNTDNTHIHR